MEEALQNSFYNLKQDSCFSSRYHLYKNAKKLYPSLTLKNVDDWLLGEPPCTLHRNVIRNFPHNKTISNGIRDQYQIDLIDMRKYSSYNDGFDNILTCIDIFTKYAWAIPIRSKRAQVCADAFRKILKDGVPRKVQSDQGMEFEGRQFQDLLKSKKIKFFFSTNRDVKCAVVERFNRTLKTRLWRYFTHNNTFRFVESLQSIVSAYNHTIHRSIKCRPVDVTEKNESDIWITLYGGKPGDSTFKYSVGDKVRLAKKKGTFAKGYVPQWTEEIFTISQAVRRSIPVYKVKDYNGNPILGFFYEREIQKVTKTDQTYRVESILGKRRKNGRKEVLVKWFGYGDEFNQWVSEKDVKDI